MRHRVKDISEEHIAQEHTTEETCHHYWIIEEPDGPTSRGRCKFCGVEREFLNSLPAYTAVKKPARVLELPEMADVELEKGSNS